MSTISKPNDFTASTTISSSQVNDNFDTIYNDYNGGISSANLASSAVTTAKIADSNVTTAKIADGAVTSAKVVGIDKSVLTTDSNPYKFRVRRVAALNSTGGSFAKITFDTEDYDSNSNFDSTTNNRYTAPVAGFYQFNARASVNGNTVTVIALYKNGSIYQRGSHMAGINGVVGVVYSDIVQAAANDYFEIFVYTDTTSAYEVSTGSQSYFSGYLVSRT